jgi:hypothetical protein
MQTDVAGRVKNISLAASRPLLPLYEAVVNSIQAIQDVGEQDGEIEIDVLRDDAHLLKDDDPSFGAVIGFEVTDNGIGFDEDNYHAFGTSDTTYKAQRGGKGIGRFLWLVAFDRVEIDSHFADGSAIRRRQFEFVPEGDGIRGMTLSDSDQKTRSTIVHLKGFHGKYQEQCPKKLETIAVYLVEHCLEYFIRDDCPRISIRDRSANERIDLNDFFHTQISAQSSRDEVVVGDGRFYAMHVRLYSSHISDHQVHFCANSRMVKSEKLMGHIPHLARRLQDSEGRAFTYAAYVDSSVLDESVNAERTDFTILEDNIGMLAETLTWQSIRQAVFARCAEYLKPYTDPVQQQKSKRVERFLATDGPMYRSLLKYIPDALDYADPEISDDDLDMTLYRASQKLQVEARDEGRKLLDQAAADQQPDEFASQFEEYFEKIGDLNKMDLARYVWNRKMVLEFLQKQLSRADDGKYHKEDLIHQIIFPLRKTSDEVLFERHNLWLLDERLVYHSFLASDKPLQTIPPIDVGSAKRPDIVVFGRSCAFAPATEQPFPSVVIIEFKRPMRDDHKEDDNPIVQVLEYVGEIREGRARTSDGRDIPIMKDIPFFCYIIADITPSLAAQAKLYDLDDLPEGQGFFGYRKQFNAYVEVLSYSKVLTDAKKRNAAFFHQLGLPDRITP